MHGDSWHVLHVRSNFEKRVAQHLAVRAIDYYLPIYREKVKWTDRTVVAERPLFSGYIFARYQRNTRTTVISIPGVVRSLGDEAWNMISCADVDRIREGLATGAPIRPHPHITTGTRVRVRSGVFEGVEGLVTEFRQQCKVIITLSQLQRCFSLEVGIPDIEVVNPVRQPFMMRPVVNPQRGWAVSSAFGD